MISKGSIHRTASGFTPSDALIGMIVTEAASGLSAGEVALCTASDEPCGIITDWNGAEVTIAVDGDDCFVLLGADIPAAYPAGSIFGCDSDSCATPVTVDLTGTAFAWKVGSLVREEVTAVAADEGLYPCHVSIGVVPVAA